MFLLLYFYIFKGSAKFQTFSSESLVSICMDGVGVSGRSLTYTYFNYFLAHCKQTGVPEQAKTSLSLKDLHNGNQLKSVGITIYNKNKDNSVFCSDPLDDKSYNEVLAAVKKNFSYQFVVDGLTAHSLIGKIDDDEKITLFQKFDFNIFYNDNNIVGLTVSSEDPKDLVQNKEISFSYSVKWSRSPILANNRLNPYIKSIFLATKAHKYSLIQVILQISVLSAIIYLFYQQMVADFDSAQGIIDFDDFEQKTNDRGWKMLHGDVFRNPSHASTLSVLVGSGSLVFSTVFIVLIISYSMNIEKFTDSVFNTTIFVYILSAFLAGFVASTLGNSFGIRQWLRLVLGSVFLFPFSYEILHLLSNNIFGGRKFSFFALIVILFILFVPVLIVATIGGVVALRKRGKLLNAMNPPCEIALVPRQVPQLPWYLRMPFLCASTGLFIALSFVTELYFILHSIVFADYYNLCGYLLITFVLISFMSALFTIIIIYFILQAESYKWHWLSFLAPASTGAFVVIFSIIFYIMNVSNENNPVNSGGESIVNFIAFVLKAVVIGLAFGLTSGFSGYVGANVFVRIVFSNLKLD